MDYKTILRHNLATLAFRATYALKDTGKDFADFSPGYEVRTPKEILTHMMQMMHYVDLTFKDEKFYKIEVEDFDSAFKQLISNLKKLDSTIANLDSSEEAKIIMLCQGPILDAMTHVGQLTMLRRLSGDPVKVTKYYEAPVTIGKFEY